MIIQITDETMSCEYVTPLNALVVSTSGNLLWLSHFHYPLSMSSVCFCMWMYPSHQSVVLLTLQYIMFCISTLFYLIHTLKILLIVFLNYAMMSLSRLSEEKKHKHKAPSIYDKLCLIEKLERWMSLAGIYM